MPIEVDGGGSEETQRTDDLRVATAQVLPAISCAYSAAICRILMTEDTSAPLTE
jgi:hypothetical protein